MGRSFASHSLARLLLAVALSGPASADERVLALAPHIVEILYAVGAGEQIVGVVRFSDYPPEAKRHPQVGSYKAVTAEAALRLQPTLVIAMDETVSGLDRLRAMGLRVEYSYPETVEGVLSDILRIGRLVDREEQAKRLEAQLRERLQRLRAARPTLPIRVFYEIWHNPLVTAGGPSFISDALEEVGAVNVFRDVPLEGPRVGVESVVRAAPRVIIVPGESRDVAERMKQWREWFAGDTALAFVEAEHDLLHRPGPRLIDGMERLQRELLQAVAASAGAVSP